MSDWRVWLKPLNWAVQLMLPDEEVQTNGKFGRTHGMVSTHFSVFVRIRFLSLQSPQNMTTSLSSNLRLFFFKIRPQKSLKWLISNSLYCRDINFGTCFWLRFRLSILLLCMVSLLDSLWVPEIFMITRLRQENSLLWHTQPSFQLGT